jgi:hypothetical protein
MTAFFWGERKATTKATAKAKAKAKARTAAGPSTAFDAKCASNFAQDDSMLFELEKRQRQRQRQKQRQRQRQRQRQKQILRLTTPNLHPKEPRPLFGDPGG